jgi:hypothetical protein
LQHQFVGHPAIYPQTQLHKLPQRLQAHTCATFATPQNTTTDHGWWDIAITFVETFIRTDQWLHVPTSTAGVLLDDIDINKTTVAGHLQVH